MSNKIEGIPEGWELVAFRRAVSGDYFLNTRGLPEPWTLNVSSGSVFAIIRKIEKPKQFRPFANAKEFELHRDRWIKHPDAQDRKFKVIMFDDCGVCCYERRYSYAHLFECGTVFEDGSPFGVKVTE